MKKTLVFFAAFALVMVPMRTIAQDKSVPQPRREQEVCVPFNPSELQPNSMEKLMYDITKATAHGRPVTCKQCTSNGQTNIVCVVSYQSEGTC